MVGGFITEHFRKDLLPAKADLRWNRMVGVALEQLAWKRPDADAASTYNIVHRLTYLAVVLGLFQAFLWPGLGMSLGMMSVFPLLATALGGHQSALTLRFVVG